MSIKYKLRTARFAFATVFLATSQAYAGDLLDTRLSFVFADDNVLAKSGETTPNSPTAGFGAGNQNTQFYDNFNTKFSGFETISNIVMYKKSAAFFERVTTEAAFTALLLERPSGGVDLRDNSSYIRILYRPADWGEKESLSVTGFPVSADRFRLGYAYRISWGGNDAFTYRAASDGVPGMKLQLTRDRWYSFLGMKTAQLFDYFTKEKERLYGFMGGGGIDVTSTFRLEAGGGYFQKGVAPGLAGQNIAAPVNAAGGSAQLVYHRGAPVGASVDFKLYKNDPEVFERFFTPEQYPGGVSGTFSLEGSYLTQTLEDPDVFGATVRQKASAAAMQARVKVNYLRVHALALYRTVSFIQFDVPGFPPFSDFPDGTKLSPEVFAALGCDYHFPGLHLTPGLIFGVQQLASFKSPSTVLGGNNPPAGLVGQRTVVVRAPSLMDTLPPNYEPLPVLSAKATFRWDLSDTVAAAGEIYYTRDANRTTFRDSTAGIAVPSFEKEHALGFNTLVQVRF